MINSEIKDTQSTLTFPVLMQARGYPELVVLFTGWSQGVVLSEERHILDAGVGTYCNLLTPLDDSNWEPFTGTLELSNK